ncbi:MAG: fused MFS/spermidine synthase [Elusimicrobiota bacterium]
MARIAPGAAAFLCSFLLFQLELIAAKLLLPAFGGGAHVWTTCLLFFQSALLVGYLYARGALACFSAPSFAKIHAGLLLLPLFCFPLALGAPRPGPSPVLELLGLLALTVGAPFLALSTASPMLTGWLGRDAGDEAYTVYAASNAGALAGLLSYPFIVEPLLGLKTQLVLWQGLYLAAAALHWMCLPSGVSPAQASRPVSARAVWTWVLLSLGPSASLLAATNMLSLDFASVPLLWVLPLALYLSTFIAAFKRVPWYPRRMSLVVLGFIVLWAALAVLTVAAAGDQAERWAAMRRLWALNKLVFLSGALFLVCLVCHRALAQSKPESGSSARFYVWVAVGGWLGSVLVAALLPWLGRSLAMPELDWALAGLLCVAGLALTARPLAGAGEERLASAVRAVCAVLFFAATAFGFYLNRSTALAGEMVYAVRNFYGTCAVVDHEGVRKFFHGNTLHGEQALDPARKGEPLLYYHRRGPLGEVYEKLGGAWKDIGVVGLGVGVVAAYGRPGQRLDFYELDPDVIKIAHKDFSFLRDTKAAVRVVPGDARRSLVDEPPERVYDALLLDAFSSGAIPVHLLTREALELYLRHLAPKGVLAFQITNRFLDLKPVLSGLGKRLGLSGAWRAVEPKDFIKDELNYSVWVVLARDGAALAPLRASGWQDLGAVPPAEAWTDERASLWAALRL